MKDVKQILAIVAGAIGLSALLAPAALAGAVPATNPTQTSPRGKAFIKSEEGFSAKAYPDGVLKYSIAYGHQIIPGDGLKPSSVITVAEGDQIFDRDIPKYEKVVRDNVRVPITQNMFDALTSLAYNVGVGAFAKYNLLKRLNAGDYDGARAEFTIGFDAAHMGRRQREANLFATRG